MKLDIGLIIDDVWYVFYTYSIKSSITSHLTDRLAIATLRWGTSSTAFLYALLIEAYRTKSVCENPYNTSKYLVL